MNVIQEDQSVIPNMQKKVQGIVVYSRLITEGYRSLL
jgi:hypothetical protein